MSVKDEGRFDGSLGRFAPSQAFGRGRGDPANWIVRSSSFEDAFRARTWQHIEDASLFYNFAAPLPGDGSATTNSALTSETTLGELRGKIVLLRRFEGGQDIGFEPWRKQQVQLIFSSAVDLKRKAYGYSKTINPRLNDYLAESPQGRVGIVVMDYFEEPRELVSNVIKKNSTAGATGGQDGGRGSRGRPTGR